MIRLRLFFRDHQPVIFEGDLFSCVLQIKNARLYPGFVSYDVLEGVGA